jgi:hypothetical protein
MVQKMHQNGIDTIPFVSFKVSVRQYSFYVTQKILPPDEPVHQR